MLNYPKKITKPPTQQILRALFRLIVYCQSLVNKDTCYATFPAVSAMCVFLLFASSSFCFIAPFAIVMIIVSVIHHVGFIRFRFN